MFADDPAGRGTGYLASITTLCIKESGNA
jgi:hypothetical protein